MFNIKNAHQLKVINKTSKYNTKQITLTFVGVISLALTYLLPQIAKHNLQWIETYYTNGIYLMWSSLLTYLNQLFFFSLSEVFYLLMSIAVVFFLFIMFIELIHRRWSKALTSLLIVFVLLSSNALYYQLAWGLNNYRLRAEDLFDLHDIEIKIEDLSSSYHYLVLKTNEYKELIEKQEINKNYIMKNAYLGYEKLNAKYDFISSQKVKVKPLIISPLFSTSGYTGIYLPLFSESNINIMPPESSLAFTSCHEIAHQKGFASEDEANFVGFLACVYHDDLYFKYSGYQAMMIYVGNSLYKNDQELYKELSKLRSEAVILDLKERNIFWDTYVKKTSQDIHNKVNDAFLKANNQPDGIVNYSKVTELFIKAYKQQLFNEL